MPSPSPSALTVEPVSRQDRLLKVIDIDGAIVTLDAMHTQPQLTRERHRGLGLASRRG